MFFITYVLCCLKFFKLKPEGQTIQTETAPKSRKIEIKILTNPGLPLLGFEQPDPGYYRPYLLVVI